MSLEQLLKQLADGSGLSWKAEAFDLALANSLSDSERGTYVGKLIEAAQQGSDRAIMTLGYMHATEAVPVLLALGKSDEPTAPTARRALVLLGRGPDVVDEIARDAVSLEDEMDRMAAVVDLPKIGGATAIFALQQALLDEDSNVRVVAWDGLIDALGLTKRLESPEGVRELTTEVEVMRVLLGTELIAVARVGANRLREIARRLAAGATAQQLGIAWRPRSSPEVFDKLRKAVFDTNLAFPVEEIATLRGAERQLAEAMIARRLEDWDIRATDALVELGAAWLAPALAELAEWDDTPEDLREELAEAARDLSTT
jgi:HEAT repeat protein